MIRWVMGATNQMISGTFGINSNIQSVTSQQAQLMIKYIIYLLRRYEDSQQPRPPGLQTLVSEATLSSHVNSVP